MQFCRGGVRRTNSWWSVLVLAIVLSGCAGRGLAPEVPKEGLVAKRAQERWNFLVQADLDNAYQYFSPAYRQVLPLALYKGKVNPRYWREAKVAGVTCAEGDRCTVEIELAYKVVTKQSSMNGTTVLHEVWVLVGGQWWFVPDRNEPGVGG